MPASDNDDEKGIDYRKVYGAGFHAGLKAASNEGDQMLSAGQFQIRESNLTMMAKKTLGIVPITECWSTEKCVSELGRVTQTNPDFRVIAGCLNSLKEAGLIIEPTRGQWQRAKVRKSDPATSLKAIATIAQQGTAQAIEAPATETPPQPLAPLEKLAQCAIEARGMATYLAKLADTIETAALEYEAETEEVKKQHDKLAQLRALLKDV